MDTGIWLLAEDGVIVRWRFYASGMDRCDFIYPTGDKHMSGEKMNATASNMQVDVGNGALVSMQTVQHIYNEITGRSEELSRSYSLNHITSFADIKQLHIKLCQLLEQYNVVSINCAITLYHLDDQKQVFSSFDRFELYDQTTLSPVENVRIEYNFLIVLPQVKKPQSYQIEINIQSRATLAKRAKLESNFHADLFMGMFEDRTANLEIKYIDYSVARNLQITIDGWFKGLKCAPSYSWLKPIKRISEDFPLIFRLSSITIYLWTCLSHFSSLLVNKSSDLSELYYVAIITFGGVMIVSSISSRLGTALGGSIRRIRALSFLKLTRGDDAAQSEFESNNTMSWIKGLASIVGAIVLNLLSSWLATKIGLAP
jgi:hypothetical protein